MPRNMPSPPLVFLGLFALSRIAISIAGIAPDPAIVGEFWQHLDIALLHSDPLGSLWNLQAQPPLWNAVLALAVAIGGPDAGAVAAIIHAFHIALSAIGGLLFMSVLVRIGTPRFGAAILAAAALCLPSMIYYENLVFYSHLTFVHVMALVWLLFRIERGGPLWPVFSALAVLVSLSWIWAVFHPLFVILFGALFVWWSRGGMRAAGAVALAAILAALPTAKNAIVFHQASASGWIGMNLAQTAPALTMEQERHCTFIYAWQEVSSQPVAAGLHPVLTQKFKSSGQPNMNHVGLMDRGAECAKIAQDNIRANPGLWLNQRIEALVRSHQKLPYNYDFNPLGWSAMAPLEQAQQQLGALGRSLTIASYILLAFWAAREVFRGQRRELHLTLLLLLGYFTFASHIANGTEQQRMRYTIEPVYLLLTAEALMAAWRSRARSRQGERVEAQG
jgi:hypothetical protein